MCPCPGPPVLPARSMPFPAWVNRTHPLPAPRLGAGVRDGAVGGQRGRAGWVPGTLWGEGAGVVPGGRAAQGPCAGPRLPRPGMGSDTSSGRRACGLGRPSWQPGGAEPGSGGLTASALSGRRAALSGKAGPARGGGCPRLPPGLPRGGRGQSSPRGPVLMAGTSHRAPAPAFHQGEAAGGWGSLRGRSLCWGDLRPRESGCEERASLLPPEGAPPVRPPSPPEPAPARGPEPGTQPPGP